MATVEPNHYALSDNHITVTYSTMGIAGQPTLTYKEGTQSLMFTGGQIRVADTEIGKLVSVTVKPSVDTGATSFSILIPVIELASVGASQAMETAGIKTVHKGPLSLPSTGVREVYQIHDLKGTASFVMSAAAQSGAAQH